MAQGPGGPGDLIVYQEVNGQRFSPDSPELLDYMARPENANATINTVWQSQLNPVPMGIDFPEFGETTEEILAAYLQYGPAFAQAQMEEQQLYLPQQAQLAQDLAEEFQPQQLGLQAQLTGEYLPQFAAIDRQIIEAEREGDLNQVLALSSMLPQIREAAESPEVTAIRQMLGTGLQEQLAFGTQLTPEQARVVEQELRASEAARGIELGQGSANRESVAKAIEGQELLNQRQQAAQGFLGQEAATQIDPFLAIAGRPSTSLSAGMGQQAGGLALPTSAGQTPNSASFLNTIAGVNANQGNQAAQSAQMGFQGAQYSNALQLALADPNLHNPTL